MTYIDYINQFWQTRRIVQFSSKETDLYFYLLYECNFRNWPNSFECPNKTICAAINVVESTLIDVRNRLQQKGLIRFKAGQRKAKSPVYELLYFANQSINTSINASINRSKNPNSNTRAKSKNNTTPAACPPSGDAASAAKGEAAKVESATQGRTNPPKVTSEENTSPLAAPPSKPEADPFEAVKKFYNENCHSLRPVTVLTDRRRQSIAARQREFGTEAIYTMLRQAGESKFLAGQNPRGWTADFDWLFKPTNFLKVNEGKYANEERRPYYGYGVGQQGAAKSARDAGVAGLVAEKMQRGAPGMADSGDTAPEF